MGQKAKKRFGQNFLRDQFIIQKIINCIRLRKNDYVVEIGPGDAALTLPMIELIGEVNAIEIDTDLCKVLEKKCEPYGKLNLINDDVLNFDFSKNKNNACKARIVGNLPYNISTPILFHLLSYRKYIKDMNFMLQKEVVERLAAEPNTKNYGRLSVMLQTYCEINYLFDIDASAFEPIPKVTSSFVNIKPTDEKSKNIKDPECFSSLVLACFSHRRKTLANNLKSILSERKILAMGINPKARAETLEIKDFINLSNEIN